jgi:transcriptional regulator with XRE-family HTH domain
MHLAYAGEVAKEPTLGDRLRGLREAGGLSLRKVARDSGLNSGYLSQLERNEIAQPTPSVLQKVAAAYGESLGTLMRWAGYIEDDPAGISPNAKRALSYLGDNFSEEELEALKAVLEVIRRKGATFATHRYDRPLDPDEADEATKHAIAVLRELDALGKPPTNIDDALVVAKLVKAGEITLTLDERKRLRRLFGSVADWAWQRLQGVVHLESREVWVNPEIRLDSKKRFVLGHEVGHVVLPAQRETFAYLDDHSRLRPDVVDLFERQANQFAIELLAQGDTLRREWDDGAATMERLCELHDRYAISLQATARYVAERSRRACAIALAFRGREGQAALTGQHIFTSPEFESRMRWQGGRCPAEPVRATILEAARGIRELEPIPSTDIHGRAVSVGAQGLDAHYAVILLFTVESARRPISARLNPFAANLDMASSTR